MTGFSSVIALTLLTATASVHAAGERRAPSPLDARIKHRDGGAISVLPEKLESLASSDELRARWNQFQSNHGGGWTVYLDERTAQPTLVSGRGVAWLPDVASTPVTLSDVDRSARAFLDGNASVLGASPDLLELDRDASMPLRDGHWQLVYRQRVDGVRVENARLDLHVVRGRMVLMGTENWARPRTRGVPKIDAGAALTNLEAYLGLDAAGTTLAGEPELVLIAVSADPKERDDRAWSGARGQGLKHVLVWRFHLDETAAGGRWIGEIDAHDGTVSAFYETTQNASTTGGVFPMSSDGNCATGGCETAGFPMPYADFTEAGQAEQFGDDYGNLMCVNPAATVETNLIGPYVRILDVCGFVSKTATCEGGIDLGLKAGENCTVAPGGGPGNTAAARTAYYHVNRVAELARFYNPANTWLNGRLTANINVNATCNATWDGTAINMYQSGGGCSNTGENPGILVHEWGHGYDQNDGGGMDKPSEAYADIVAILTTRASCMGRGTYTNGGTCTGYGDACLTCTGFREFDWTQRASETPATPTNFVQPHCGPDPSSFGGPCRREPHCESYVSSEAMFDLATRDLPASGMSQDSAWQLAERLWFMTRPGSGGNAYTCSIPVSNSCGVTSWYQRMRVADDDDGNLANGTPHAAALFAAFQRHAIACGTAADATNQNHTSCPQLAAPVVSRSMTPAGVQLSWAPVAGAGTYRVYRGELGCNRQQIPIASVPAGQTTYVDNSRDTDTIRQYRVEAFGASSVCSSPVSNCVGAPPGAVLSVASQRLVDDGDGVPEPGETIALPVSVRNAGTDAATSVAATLDLVAPAGVRILTPQASWPPIAPNATTESTLPGFQAVVLPEASCGQTLTFDLNGSASNAPPFSSQIALPMGNPLRDYSETSIVIVPYVTTSPVTAQWVVTDDRTIAELDLSLDLFHQTPAQIVVSLTSPQGTTVRLHDRGAGSGHGIQTRFDRDTQPSGPGTMADFAGESTLGTWTLSVEDLDASGITTDGYIRPRTLHVTIAGGFGCQPIGCAQPTPTVAPNLQVTRVDDGSQLDLVLSWTAAAGAGYHVLQSTDPTFGAGVKLIANPATNAPLTLQDGAHTTPALTFFQVRAVNSCHFEGP
jgi:subtilisin-like proprotein convertase family protein